MVSFIQEKQQFGPANYVLWSQQVVVIKRFLDRRSSSRYHKELKIQKKKAAVSVLYNKIQGLNNLSLQRSKELFKLHNNGQPNIADLIAQQLQNIIPQIVTQVTNNVNNGNGGNGGNGGNNGCSYKAFQDCGPKEYDGKGGTIALTRWIEKMESARGREVAIEAGLYLRRGYYDGYYLVRVTRRERRVRRRMLKSSGSWRDKKRRRVESIGCVLTARGLAILLESVGHHLSEQLWLNRAPGQAGNPLALEGNRNNRNNGNQTRGRAYNVNVNAVEASRDPKVVTSTFSLNDYFAIVLFDSGADFSFISTEFVSLLNVKPSIVNPGYVIEIADGKKVEVDRIIRGCKLELGNSLFTIDLIPLGHGSFDVIMGMDWLSQNKAVIVCHEKVVEIPLIGGEILRVQGERALGVGKTLMNVKVDKPKMGDISVVWDFVNVFLEDFSGLPPQRQVEFRIDLIPGATPIVKSSYRLAPLKI
ncbi:putative reverse transcriptase domain-containing protein [Tanacetum coccineum]